LLEAAHNGNHSKKYMGLNVFKAQLRVALFAAFLVILNQHAGKENAQ
jgi:hypothetical protein